MSDFSFTPEPVEIPTTVKVKLRARIHHVGPVLPFDDIKFLLDRCTYLFSATSPKGNPQDVRAAQRLQLVTVKDGSSTRNELSYKEVCDIITDDKASRDAGEPSLPDPCLNAFMNFKLAVDSVIPYTVANLVHDVGVDRVLQVLGRDHTERTVRERLRHHADWGASDLAMLRLAFPQLDLEATCHEQLFWQSCLHKGPFRNLAEMELAAVPAGLVKFAIKRGLIPSATRVENGEM